MVALVVFGWGIADSVLYLQYSENQKEGILRYWKIEDTRSYLFLGFIYFVLAFRFMSIIVFANALYRFWKIFRKVNDKATMNNR